MAALYGVVSIGYGIYGFIETSNRGEPSYPSLFAGTGAGIVLLLCAGGTFYKPLWALLIAALVSIALLGRFLPKVVKYLNGAESEIASVAVVMTVGGLLTLFVAAFALATKRSC